MSNEAEIRALIERWATAVHARDLDSVLADHADDIVMFDVPPRSPTRTPRRRERRDEASGSAGKVIWQLTMSVNGFIAGPRSTSRARIV